MKLNMKLIMNVQMAKTKKNAERNQNALEGTEEEDTQRDE